jgi:integrase
VADVERAEFRAGAGGQEVTSLKRGELLATQPGVAEDEHEGDVARAGDRVIGDPRLRLADETLVLPGGECLRRVAARAGLPDELRHPHALRHTCATELLRAGANVADVRAFLGHASIKTTSIYLASDDERQEDIVAARERGRSPSTRVA